LSYYDVRAAHCSQPFAPASSLAAATAESCVCVCSRCWRPCEWRTTKHPHWSCSASTLRRGSATYFLALPFWVSTPLQHPCCGLSPTNSPSSLAAPTLLSAWL